MGNEDTALVVMPRQAATLQRRERPELVFTAEQQQMIRNTYANGASEQEFQVLLAIAKAKRLNPLLGQIHFIKRWTQRGEVWAAQTGIDGFRSIAEDTGLYDGQDEPEFQYVDEDPKKQIQVAKVRVYRKDVNRAFVGVAHFTEYAQRMKEGQLTKMWAEKPHIMIAKCAESLAMRKAFPQDLGDLYTAEEMGRANEDHADRLSSQIAPSEERALPDKKEYWLKRIFGAKTDEELDALTKELGADKDVKGDLRKVLGAAFKKQKADLKLSAPAKCAACELVGTHAVGCPEDEPKVEREPGSEG